MGAKQASNEYPFPPDDARVWFHLILTTYGSWLYGDARGFRTRHHREHVEGDYQNLPPPGKYTAKERKSRASLKQPPVVIPVALRSVVGVALIELLVDLGGFVLSAAVSGQHSHIQARLVQKEVRETAGLAKKHAWFELREHRWKGKLWGKRGKAKRIRDREHHRHVYQYILNHEQESAWVWRWTPEQPMPINRQHE